MYDLGTGTSFNVSSYEGYENFTIDNFLYKVTDMTIPATSYQGASKQWSTSGTTTVYNYFVEMPATNAVSKTPTLTYNNTTGVLSVTNTSLSLTFNAKGGCAIVQSTLTINTSKTYTCNLTIRMYLVV